MGFLLLFPVASTIVIFYILFSKPNRTVEAENKFMEKNKELFYPDLKEDSPSSYEVVKTLQKAGIEPHFLDE